MIVVLQMYCTPSQGAPDTESPSRHTCFHFESCIRDMHFGYRKFPHYLEQKIKAKYVY